MNKLLIFAVFMISSLFGYAGEGDGFTSKSDFISYLVNYRNILGVEKGKVDSMLGVDCKSSKVQLVERFSANSYTFAYSCKIENSRFLVAFNDETPKKKINDFILVASFDSYEELSSKVGLKYGKCRDRLANKEYSSCTYSIGRDPELGTKRIAVLEKNEEKKAAMFTLSVESGDGP